jgi:hypothetical protein
MVTGRLCSLIPLAAVGLVAGCNNGFQKESIVVDLRVLALRSDPAEVVVDVNPADLASVELPDVVVTALIGDPQGPRPLAYTLTACPMTDSRRCDDASAPKVKFADMTTDDAEAMPPTGTLHVDVALLQAALAADTFHGLGGIPVQVELAIGPVGGGADAAVYAEKFVTYAARIPAGRTANRNPTIAELLADDTPFDPMSPLSVAAGQRVTLEPKEPDGVRETYATPTLDGGERTFTENMRYSWLATAGSFSDEHTGGPVDAFGNQPLLRTHFTAPPEPGPVKIWVVQRDERGGTYWTERVVMVHN